MLNNDNGDQNCLVLMKVQGLRAGFVDQCMHSAKCKECRTSRIQGVQNKHGKVATTKGYEGIKDFDDLGNILRLRIVQDFNENMPWINTVFGSVIGLSYKIVI